MYYYITRKCVTNKRLRWTQRQNLKAVSEHSFRTTMSYLSVCTCIFARDSSFCAHPIHQVSRPSKQLRVVLCNSVTQDYVSEGQQSVQTV